MGYRQVVGQGNSREDRREVDGGLEEAGREMAGKTNRPDEERTGGWLAGWGEAVHGVVKPVCSAEGPRDSNPSYSPGQEAGEGWGVGVEGARNQRLSHIAKHGGQDRAWHTVRA